MNTAQSKIAAVLFAAGVVCVPQYFLYGRLAVNYTDSVPVKLFWRQTGRAPALGEYASFFRGVPGEEGALDITKRVACGPGDFLSVDGLHYFCNGQFMATAKLETQKGLPLKRFVYTGKIPEGRFFALGHSFRRDGLRKMVDDSYDSRYFGFVRLDEAWRAVPLL